MAKNNHLRVNIPDYSVPKYEFQCLEFSISLVGLRLEIPEPGLDSGFHMSYFSIFRYPLIYGAQSSPVLGIYIITDFISKLQIRKYFEGCLLVENSTHCCSLDDSMCCPLSFNYTTSYQISSLDHYWLLRYNSYFYL